MDDMTAMRTKKAVGGLGVAALLLLGGCGQDGGQVTSGDVTDASQTQSGSGDDVQGADGDMQVVQLGVVAVSIPSSWVETPDDDLQDGDWTMGYDDAQEEPAVRLRMAPAINDSPHPDIAEGELVARAMAGGYYGTEWEGVHREKTDIPGAFRGFVTDFTYVSSDGKDMNGRWWLMTSPDTYEVAALEISGESDVLTEDLIEEISSSVRLEPQ